MLFILEFTETTKYKHRFYVSLFEQLLLFSACTLRHFVCVCIIHIVLFYFL
jgi:hypothetical protein